MRESHLDGIMRSILRTVRRGTMSSKTPSCLTQETSAPCQSQHPNIRLEVVRPRLAWQSSYREYATPEIREAVWIALRFIESKRTHCFLNHSTPVSWMDDATGLHGQPERTASMSGLVPLCARDAECSNLPSTVTSTVREKGVRKELKGTWGPIEARSDVV